MGGKRKGAGRHRRDCDCARCVKKNGGSRPVDANLARKIKAKINAEAKWLRIIELETELAERTGKTGPLRTSLIYLDNRDLGNTLDTVNHIHDKPIEMSVTLSLAETIQKARKRAARN